MNKVFLLIILLIMALFFSCTEPTEAELACRELEETLRTYPQDIETVKNLMNLYFFEVENFERIVELFEEYESDFSDNVEAQVLYGAALCANANNMEETEDQVFWVSRGMIVLDRMVEEYPKNSLVYIWRAITYSNFPVILNTRSIVEHDLDYCFTRIKSGEWVFSESRKVILYQAIYNVAITYKDKAYLERGLKHMSNDSLDKGNPLFLQYKEALAKF